MENIISYQNLKSLIQSKDLLWQYTEEPFKYNIFAVESNIVYTTSVWKNSYEPLESDVQQNTNDRNDFENNYKSGANKPLESVMKFKTTPAVGVTKIVSGQRAWTFSHNFCDKTTWFFDAVRVENENVGTGDGVTTTFNLANTYIIDVVHGKITDEDNVSPSDSQGGTTYQLIIKIDGVQKTEREFAVDSGGDYIVNYETGEITFFIAPLNNKIITANYFYSPANGGSTMYVVPSPGTKLLIQMAECQFSKDFQLKDNLISAVYTYNPNLGAPPAKFEYPGTRSRYKRVADFVNFTNGSFPIVPAMGGTRGFAQDILQLRYDYVSAIELPSSAGAEMRVWSENHIPCTGEIGAITFYGFLLPE